MIIISYMSARMRGHAGPWRERHEAYSAAELLDTIVRIEVKLESLFSLDSFTAKIANLQQKEEEIMTSN